MITWNVLQAGREVRMTHPPKATNSEGNGFGIVFGTKTNQNKNRSKVGAEEKKGIEQSFICSSESHV